MKINKGIILAGGLGTRLYPITQGISKHLLPVYDKPMIYYPLSNFLNLNVQDVLIITKPNDLVNYKKLLGNGSRFGIKISYKIQKKPDGIPQSLVIGKKFIGNNKVYLNLGDHILFGKKLNNIFAKVSEDSKNNIIFSKLTKNPKDYGIIKFKNNKPNKIFEKPKKYISNKAVCGLYIYNNSIFQYLSKLKKSNRNEYEITDLNNILIQNNDIKIIDLPRSISWHDAGSFDRIFKISKLVSYYAKKNIFFGYLEHIAYKKKLISRNDYLRAIRNYPNTEYALNLKKLLTINESY